MNIYKTFLPFPFSSLCSSLSPSRSSSSFFDFLYVHSSRCRQMNMPSLSIHHVRRWMRVSMFAFENIKTSFMRNVRVFWGVRVNYIGPCPRGC